MISSKANDWLLPWGYTKVERRMMTDDANATCTDANGNFWERFGIYQQWELEWTNLVPSWYERMIVTDLLQQSAVWTFYKGFVTRTRTRTTMKMRIMIRMAMTMLKKCMWQVKVEEIFSLWIVHLWDGTNLNKKERKIHPWKNGVRENSKISRKEE